MSERDTSDKPQLTPDCCEVWPKLIKHLRWFTYSDWPEIATMPNIAA